MNKLVTLSVWLSLLVTLLPAMSPPATVWAEGPAWVDDGSGCWATSGNAYVMTGKLQDAGRYTHWSQEFCDFTVQADVQKTQGDCAQYGWGYGLYFRSDGTQKNYYEFILNIDGLYQIGKSVDGKFSKLVNWTASDALRSGYDQWNTLKVVGQGPDFHFYANDAHVATLTDTTFPCGKVGLFAIDGVESDLPDVVHFANIQLWPEAMIPQTGEGDVQQPDVAGQEPEKPDVEPTLAPSPLPTQPAPPVAPDVDEDAEMLDFEPVQVPSPAPPLATSVAPIGPGMDEDAEMLDFEPVQVPSPAPLPAASVPPTAPDVDEDAEMPVFGPMEGPSPVPAPATSAPPPVPDVSEDADMSDLEPAQATVPPPPPTPTSAVPPVAQDVSEELEMPDAEMPPPAGPEATALIDAGEGGEVRLPDGAGIGIPPGALDADARVSVVNMGPQSPSEDPDVQLGSEAYRFTVEGYEFFAEPVVISVPYRESDLPAGVSENDTGIAYFDEVIGDWLLELEDVSVDTAQNLVSVTTLHSSDWRPCWWPKGGVKRVARGGFGWMLIYMGTALPTEKIDLPEDGDDVKDTDDPEDGDNVKDTDRRTIVNQLRFWVKNCEAGPPVRCRLATAMWDYDTGPGTWQDEPRISAKAWFRPGRCVSDDGGGFACSGTRFRAKHKYTARPSAGGKVTKSGLKCKWDATIDDKGKVNGHLRECLETDEDGNVLSRIEPDQSGVFEATLGEYTFVQPATPTPPLTLWLGEAQRFTGKPPSLKPGGLPCFNLAGHVLCGEAQRMTIFVVRHRFENGVWQDTGYADGRWQYQDAVENPTCHAHLDLIGSFDKDRSPEILGDATGGIGGACGGGPPWEWKWEGKLTDWEDCMLHVTLFDPKQGGAEMGDICLPPEDDR